MIRFTKQNKYSADIIIIIIISIKATCFLHILKVIIKFYSTTYGWSKIMPRVLHHSLQ